MQYRVREKCVLVAEWRNNVFGSFFMLLYYLALNEIEMREQAEYKLLHI